MEYKDTFALNLSRVDCIGLSRDSTLAESIVDEVRLSSIIKSCACEAYPTCCYIYVVFVLMNSKTRQSVITRYNQ